MVTKLEYFFRLFGFHQQLGEFLEMARRSLRSLRSPISAVHVHIPSVLFSLFGRLSRIASRLDRYLAVHIRLVIGSKLKRREARAEKEINIFTVSGLVTISTLPSDFVRVKLGRKIAYIIEHFRLISLSMEICIDCLESARNAIEGGATRLEVCSALSEGGLTPTPGLVQTVKSFSALPIYAMLRLRPGNFVYTQEEMDVMLHDLRILKDHGVDGFAFGALTSNGEINLAFCKYVLSAAHPLPLTFHRAFDEVNDPLSSLEILIELGFERILTSGQRDTAEEGLPLIQRLVQAARNRIVIMPGSGIAEHNISKVKAISGAKEFHASAKKKSPTSGGTNRVKIGDSKENCIMVTDSELVREMLRIIT